MTIPAGGSLSLACTDLNVDGSLSVTSGQVSQAANVGITTTGVIDGGSGTISVGGNWSNAGSFVAGTSTVAIQDGCSTLPAQFTGDTTFYNLTLSSSTGRTIVLPAGTHNHRSRHIESSGRHTHIFVGATCRYHHGAWRSCDLVRHDDTADGTYRHTDTAGRYPDP